MNFIEQIEFERVFFWFMPFNIFGVCSHPIPVLVVHFTAPILPDEKKYVTLTVILIRRIETLETSKTS